MEETLTGQRLDTALAALAAEGAGPVTVERIGTPPGFRMREKYTRESADYVALAVRGPDGSAVLKVVSVPAAPLPKRE